MLLPTGAGKSVAFQLASLLRPGVCIVIDPIVSLIEDQIENLALAGIDRTTQIIHAMGGAEREKVLLVLARNEYQFCYVAPERFQDKHFRDTLRVLTTVTAISLVTVDEAHCVSEWGHDFRPAYLNIARTSREYCSSQGVRPPLMALTGTASRAVLKDVQRELQIDDFEAIITPTSFDRPELHFSTIPCHSSEKQLRIRGSLEGLPRTFGQTASRFFQPLGNNTMSGLVFCPHVNGSFRVLSVAQEMGNQLGLKVPFYSGKAPKGYGADSWHSVQHHTASEFKANAFPVMVCTKAFGMGIDKPNIRYTVHYTLPPSIESFYQEAGRAGRDRRPSHCSIIVSHDYPERSRRLLNPSTPLELIHEELAETGWKQDDDITRCLYFHRKAFRGIEADHQQVLALIRAVGNIGSPGTATVDFDDDSKTPTERAIHRLLTLGIVTDYTVSYGPKQFGVTFSGIGKDGIVECLRRYVAAYQRGQAQIVVDRVNKYLHREYYEFVIEITLELVRFVYDVIERSRRQALSEILALCTSCHTDSEIRERILRYLGSSVFSEAIETLLEEPDAGLSRIGDMLDEVKSPIDAGHLRGESGRALEAYPDHAGLRLLRAAAEALAKNPDEQRIRDDVQAAATFAASRYGLPHDTICGAVLSVAIGVAESFPALGRAIISGLFAGIGDKRLAARHILAAAPRSWQEEPLAVLLSQMNDNLVARLER
ncbi:MAG: RecQ family ATP-dependent DNA helicase [Planctomycetota bacterium]|nr:RecQ family ATP-dependent DNA helicase [Planctomycetota bacterium]